jgi:hypothetical protein
MAKRISDGTPGDIKGVPCENRLGRQCLDQDLEWPRSRGSVSVNYTRINACRLTRGGRAAVPAASSPPCTWLGRSIAAPDWLCSGRQWPQPLLRRRRRLVWRGPMAGPPRG